MLSFENACPANVVSGGDGESTSNGNVGKASRSNNGSHRCCSCCLVVFGRVVSVFGWCWIAFVDGGGLRVALGWFVVSGSWVALFWFVMSVVVLVVVFTVSVILISPLDLICIQFLS